MLLIKSRPAKDGARARLGGEPYASRTKSDRKVIQKDITQLIHPSNTNLAGSLSPYGCKRKWDPKGKKNSSWARRRPRRHIFSTTDMFAKNPTNRCSSLINSGIPDVRTCLPARTPALPGHKRPLGFESHFRLHTPPAYPGK